MRPQQLASELTQTAAIGFRQSPRIKPKAIVQLESFVEQTGCWCSNQGETSKPCARRFMGQARAVIARDDLGQSEEL